MFDDDVTEPGANALSSDCPGCGGTMVWDPATFALVCSFCGSSKSVESERLAPADVTIAEFEQTQVKEAFLATSKRLSCNRCGAVIDFQGAVASRCDFCGAHAVAEIHDHAEAVRPSGIIPFGVDRKAVEQAYTGWVKAQPLLPKPVREGLPLEELRGVYLPFWVFDVRVESVASARCGQEYVDFRGNRAVRWERRKKVSERQRTGLGIYASQGLPNELVDKLVPWYSESANAWEEGYLSGFPAEAPRVAPVEAWESAKKQIKRLELLDIHGAFGADRVANVKMECEFQGASVRLIYMPVWVAAYRFQGRVFRFLVNGRTGEATGQAPVDRRQVAIFSIVLFLLVALVVLPGVCTLLGVDWQVGEAPEIPGPAPIELDVGDGGD